MKGVEYMVSLPCQLHEEKTIWHVAESLYESVQEIANDSTHAGYMTARVILSKIDGNKYPEIIIFNPPSQEYQIRQNAIAIANGQRHLRNYPNPFNNSTTVEAIVSEDYPGAELHIYNLIGGVIAKYTLHEGINAVQIPDNALGAGMYYYSLVSCGKRIETDKMLKLQ